MMQDVAAKQIKNCGFPGCTIFIILHHNNMSGAIAVGFADPATGRQLTGHEPSRMASMTKTYTSAAILRLMEMGKLDISSAMSRHLTPQTLQLLHVGGYRSDEITIRQLLQHTSGLPNYDDDAYKEQILENPQHHWTRLEQLKWAMNHSKPIGAPGEIYSYSDTGYILLGEIIEQVSGLPQAVAYRKLLSFERLGLKHTWFETLEPAPADLPARAHQFVGDLDATNFNPSFDLFGGGGLISTLEDEATFLRALMSGEVFDCADTLDIMLSVPTTSAQPADGVGATYAMGIYSVVIDGQTCWGHAGFWGTSFFHCPSADVTVATNRYQSVEPTTGYDAFEVLKTALRMTRLAPHPATR